MLPHDCNWVVTLKGRLAYRHFIKNDAKGVYIAVLIASIALRLLRRNIQRRAKLSIGKRACRHSQKFGYTKVGENGFSYRIVCRVVCIEQNISRFEVAMN